MRLQRYPFAVLMGLSILIGCAVTPVRTEGKAPFGEVPPVTQVSQVSINGIDRSYVIHIPPNYNETRNWPVVLMFHGGGGIAITS